MECQHVLSGVRISKLDIDVIKRGRRNLRCGEACPQPPVAVRLLSLPHLKHHPSAYRRELTDGAHSSLAPSRPVASASSWDTGNWNCVECGTALSPWLCLYCGLIHCGRYVNQDGLRHYNHLPQHNLCMDCRDFSVFWNQICALCFSYSCDDFVCTDTVDRKIRSVRESLQYYNAVRSNDHSYFWPRFLPSPNRTNGLIVSCPVVNGVAEKTMPVKRPLIRNGIVTPKKVAKIEPEEEEEEQRPENDSTFEEKKKKKEAGPKARNARDFGLRGLRNLGNTCFMNAVLQSLNNISEFSDSIVTLPDTLKVKNGITSPAHRTRSAGTEQVFLAEELRKTLRAMKETEKNSALSPDALFSVIWKLVPRFRGFQQHDAHEFLRCVLDRLLVELKQWKPLEGSAHEGGLVSSLFQGALQSEVTCLSCAGSSTKQDPFLDLSLDIPSCSRGKSETLTLLECLESFFDKEELDASEQYMCSWCRRKRPSTKQFFVRQAPHVLCLHLKRFKWHQGRQKIDHFVQFPLSHMDLSPFLLSSLRSTRRNGGPKESHLFDLAALVVHHGSSAGSGHYTAFVRRDNAWFHLNDSAVRTSSEAAVLQQKAYILFYVRRKNPSIGTV